MECGSVETILADKQFSHPGWDAVLIRVYCDQPNQNNNHALIPSSKVNHSISLR